MQVKINLRNFFRSIATIITAILAILLVVIVISTYINPSRLYFFAFMGYLFSVVWIANVLSLIYWGVKFRKQALIPILAIIIGWTQWQNTFQWKDSTIEDIRTLENRVTIMSFNVKMLDFYNWSGNENLHEEIFDYIRKENPDIVCFQEFYSNNKSKRFSENHIIARLNQYPYRHIEYRQQNSNGSNFGLATFSKFPIKENKILKFKNTTNFSIQTDIRVNKLTIRVFNNHLQSLRLNKQQLSFIDGINTMDKDERKRGLIGLFRKLRHAFMYRGEQAQNISRHIINSPYPVIVCGDFNDTPISYVYRKVRGNLKDAFVESGKGFGGTYNGKYPSFRIDYILFDPTFKAYNFKRDVIELSDHYPIITTLEMVESDSNKK